MDDELGIRSRAEFISGHAAGAIHLSKGIIECADIETRVPDKSATLVLYCGGGFRSALAADNLMKMGYEHPILSRRLESVVRRGYARREVSRLSGSHDGRLSQGV